MNEKINDNIAVRDPMTNRMKHRNIIKPVANLFMNPCVERQKVYNIKTTVREKSKESPTVVSNGPVNGSFDKCCSKSSTREYRQQTDNVIDIIFLNELKFSNDLNVMNETKKKIILTAKK